MSIKPDTSWTFFRKDDIYIHTYIYTYIYIYTHTHTYIYIYTRARAYTPLCYGSSEGHVRTCLGQCKQLQRLMICSCKIDKELHKCHLCGWRDCLLIINIIGLWISLCHRSNFQVSHSRPYSVSQIYLATTNHLPVKKGY